MEYWDRRQRKKKPIFYHLFYWPYVVWAERTESKRMINLCGLTQTQLKHTTKPNVQVLAAKSALCYNFSLVCNLCEFGASEIKSIYELNKCLIYVHSRDPLWYCWKKESQTLNSMSSTVKFKIWIQQLHFLLQGSLLIKIKACQFKNTKYCWLSSAKEEIKPQIEIWKFLKSFDFLLLGSFYTVLLFT